MGKKRELKRISGNPDNIGARMTRTGLSKPELAQHDQRFTTVTYRKKPAPRSNWYPETPDIHIEGKK